MNKLSIAIIICLLTFSSCAQMNLDRWYKGNLHTHSYWSDGNDFPEMIIDWYKTNGYDFVALSDHNVLSQGEKWKLIPDNPSHQEGFKRYLEKYGKRWVEYKDDENGVIHVKLKTFSEYVPLFYEENKFLIVQAEEISSKGPHIGAVNIAEGIIPNITGDKVQVAQNMLDQVYEQRNRTGQVMFAHINHPNFPGGLTPDEMMLLRGDRFFEVYNGHPSVVNFGNFEKLTTDELWDKYLINCFTVSKPMIFGMATDDTHDYLQSGVGRSNAGRGWVMVKAEELTAESLIKAMEKGDFYASTGVLLKAISFKRRKLTIKIQEELGVTYSIQFWGVKKGNKERILLKEIKGNKASYKLTSDDLYVRSKVISDKLKENPFQKGEFEMAWTQPMN